MQPVKEKSLVKLRELLFKEDLQKLKQLEDEVVHLKARLSDKEALLISLEPIIADLLERKIVNSRNEMAEVLAPIMSAAIRHQIVEAKEDVIDALYPIIGKTIRKSVAEAMKKLVDSVNQRIDRVFKGKLFARQVKSKITGVSRGELFLKEALPFQIEEIFVIHKATGLLIKHVSAVESTASVDENLISGMLTAIRDFVAESFKTDTKADLNEIKYGDLKVILEMGRYTYLAVVISGIEPDEFRENLEKLERRIHNRFYKVFRQFDGDINACQEIVKPIQKFILTYNSAPLKAVAHSPKPYLRYILITIFAILVIGFTAFKLTDFFAQRKLLKQVQSKLELIPELDLNTIEYKIDDEKLLVAGQVQSIQVKNQISSALQSIQGLNNVENQLTVHFSPPRKVQLEQNIHEKLMPFEQLPGFHVHGIVEGNHIIIEGEVPELQAKREIGFLMSEIQEAQVIINNLVVTKQQKSLPDSLQILQKELIFFNIDQIAVLPEQTAILDKLLKFSQDLENIQIKISGYSDDLADSTYNLQLSEQRARSVANYFRANNFPPPNMHIHFYGEAYPIATNKTETGRAKNRRVEIEIIQKR